MYTAHHLELFLLSLWLLYNSSSVAILGSCPGNLPPSYLFFLIFSTLNKGAFVQIFTNALARCIMLDLFLYTKPSAIPSSLEMHTCPWVYQGYYNSPFKSPPWHTQYLTVSSIDQIILAHSSMMSLRDFLISYAPGDSKSPCLHSPMLTTGMIYHLYLMALDRLGRWDSGLQCPLPEG